MPVLSMARSRGQAVACINNLKQLTTACKIYAEDNNGELVSCWPIGWGNYPVNPYSWCPGWASLTEPGGFDYGPSPQYDCTNIYSLEQGAIWPYTKQPGIYHCPSDHGTLGGWPVLRSYSMNSWMAGRSYNDPTGNTDYTTPDQDSTLTYTFFRKENQIRQPSKMFCLIDEDSSTINDAMFVVDMFTPNSVEDLPATRHGAVYQLSFNDGHAQAIPWKDTVRLARGRPRTRLPKSSKHGHGAEVEESAGNSYNSRKRPVGGPSFVKTMEVRLRNLELRRRSGQHRRRMRPLVRPGVIQLPEWARARCPLQILWNRARHSDEHRH